VLLRAYGPKCDLQNVQQRPASTSLESQILRNEMPRIMNLNLLYLDYAYLFPNLDCFIPLDDPFSRVVMAWCGTEGKEWTIPYG
jgi:hypothetical protein